MPKTKKLLTLAVATAIAGTTMLGVTSATSDYMHYQDGTISICDPSSNGTKCITMQDKNLGATQAGVGCINYANYCYAGVQDYSDMEECLADDMSQLGCMGWEYFGNLFTDEEDCNDRGQSLFEACMAEQGTGMYGKHFQWGNNNGFEIGCRTNGCSDTVTNSARGTLALWSSDYNHVGYYGITFIKGTSSSKYDYWSDNTPSNHNGLRGGENDTQENNYGYDETNNVALNVENRRGPCGEGYHVPSIGEWNQVLEYWAEENGIELEDDGGLKYNYTTLDGLKFQEDFKIPFAGYRSYIDADVDYVGNYAYLWSSSPFVGDDYARIFYLGPDVARADYFNLRAFGFSVRCFKNSYLSFPSSEGGASGGNSEIIVNIGKFNNGQNTCTGQDFIFSGIFASPATVTRNIVKTFQCAFGDMGQKAVTLQLSGDLTDGNGNTIPASKVRLKNTAWVGTPAGIGSGVVETTSYTPLNQTITLFNKVVNKIGIAEGTGVDIQIEIPGGTPNGTYNGVLILSY